MREIMTQHYTTIEQSKHLLELGLDAKSADMCYWMQYHRAIDGGGQHLEDTPSIGKGNKGSIPCWSVGSLLEVIPKRIKVEGELTSTWQLKKEANGYAIYYESISLDWYSNCIGETLIEAAYNMIVWLLENEYIKKGEQL